MRGFLKNLHRNAAALPGCNIILVFAGQGLRELPEEGLKTVMLIGLAWGFRGFGDAVERGELVLFDCGEGVDSVSE